MGDLPLSAGFFHAWAVNGIPPSSFISAVEMAAIDDEKPE
jgi:hypothetical protein